MRRELRSTRDSARAQTYALRHSLDAFQESIRQGAEALAAVHLYRAGVYLACRETLANEPSLTDIMDRLENELTGADPALLRFLIQHREMIEIEDVSADKRKMLFGILRQKNKATGLLTGRANSEIDNAKRALQRADKTAERLLTWKEGIRSGATPELLCIADIHGPSYVDQSSE
jgi:hypothetical protein